MKRIIFFILLVFIVFRPSSAQDSKENADFKLAVNLYNDKMYDLAIEQFRSFVSLYPSSQQGIDARFYLGLTQDKLGKYDDARLTFQNFALAYPDNAKAPEAWMNVASDYVLSGNTREAASAYERVKTFHPRSSFAPQALLKASELYEKLNDRENVRRVLRMLTQEYSSADVLPARLALAEMLIADGQPEQARQESKQAVDVAADASLKAQGLLVMSKALKALGRNQESEEALSTVITKFKSTPSYFSALYDFGVLRNSLGDADGAMASWTSLADNTNAPVQLRQDAFLAMGESNMHVRAFARALDLFGYAGGFRGGRNGEAWYRAGVAAECTGDMTKASPLYTRALTDSPGRADRRAILIGAFKAAAFEKNYTESVRIVRLYRQEFPRDVMLSHLLTEGADQATSNLNEPKTAEDFCSTVIDTFPACNDADAALFQLGRAHRAAGEYEAALAAFDNLQRRYPSSEFIPEANRIVWLINEFERRQSNASMQKLALLVGDVIAQKSRGTLAYRLAEIYFHEMKDYDLAAEQYRSALSQDLDEAMRPSAWYYLAQSYERQALRDGLNAETGKAMIRKTIECYDSLRSKYPAGEMSDKAAVGAFSYRLQLTDKIEDLRALGSDFFARSSSVRGKDLALLALGNSYLASKKYDDAILTYKLLLDKYPGTESAQSGQFQMGMAYRSMMKKDSAVSSFSRFLASYPNHPQSAQAAFLLAQDAADSGRVAAAADYCTLLEKRYFYTSYNKNLDLLKGTAFLNAGDYIHASSGFLAALQAMQSDFFNVAGNPDVERDIVYKLGYCAEMVGDKQGERLWYGEYITRDQSTEQAGSAYLALASLAKAENNIKLATACLTEADRINKKFGKRTSSVALETAGMLFTSEKYDDAAAKYGEALKQIKDDSTARVIQARIAVCYFRLDNLEEANARAAEFVKKYPKEEGRIAEFEFERGKYLMRKEKNEEAKARFDAVLGRYPKAPIVPEALFWIAHMYELDQKAQLAVGVYDSLLRYYPGNDIIPRVHLSLGNVYYAMEQWDAASKQYRAILDNEQHSPDLVPFAMSNCIMTYKEMELYDGALELTRKYIERFPNDPDLIDKKIDIGILYQKLGYYDRAILHLQSLIEGGNSDLEAELRYYIGESNFYKGDYQQAVLEFLKVPYLVTQRGKVDWISTSYYMAGQAYEKMSKYDQALTMYKQILERKDTDTQFKTAAQKEIERVKSVIGTK
jgi:TolA-binding protein